MIRVKGDPIEWGKPYKPLKKRVWPKHVTETIVTEIASRKVGRPRKADALTPAERARAYRERKRVNG